MGIEQKPLGVKVNPLQAIELDVFTKTSAALLLSPTTSNIPFQGGCYFPPRVNTLDLAQGWLIQGDDLVLVILLSLIQFLRNLHLT